MRSPVLEYFGVLAVFLFFGAIAAGINIARHYGIDLEVFNSIAPWLASYANYINWFFIGVLLVCAISIPPVLMFRDLNDGGERLSDIGAISLKMARNITIVALSAGVAYLFLR